VLGTGLKGWQLRGRQRGGVEADER
jgi:hypothetical protein